MAIVLSKEPAVYIEIHNLPGYEDGVRLTLALQDMRIDLEPKYTLNMASFGDSKKDQLQSVDVIKKLSISGHVINEEPLYDSILFGDSSKEPPSLVPKINSVGALPRRVISYAG